MYEKLEKGEANLKGKQKENIENNKEMAMLSRKLGTIDLDSPIEKNLEEFKGESWDNPAVLELFKQLRFKRFIERFALENTQNQTQKKIEDLFKLEQITPQKLIEKLKNQHEMNYFFETQKDENALIMKKKITKINVYLKEEKKVYGANFDGEVLKEIFENEEILKCGYQIKDDYILLKQAGIKPKNMMFDSKIAMYLLNSGTNMYALEEIAKQYLNLDLEDYMPHETKENVQTSFFDVEEFPQEEIDYKYPMYSYMIGETKPILEDELKKVNELALFYEIEMPSAEVLAEMKFAGVFVDKTDIEKMSCDLKKQIQTLSQEIYELAGEEFNINSPKQLGEILFEKLELPFKKKNKSGYSTDVDTLEKLRNAHPMIEKVLEYRQVSKLNSTFVEGMLPYINPKTNRVHTTFHQTVAATGRLSSTEPNLQNIPTRTEIRKTNPKIVQTRNRKNFSRCGLFAN